MKVKELIKKLQECSQDKQVAIYVKNIGGNKLNCFVEDVIEENDRPLDLVEIVI